MSVEHGLYIPEDPNITCFSTGYNASRLTVDETFLMFEDPWQGNFVIDRDTHPLMYDFYTTPLAFRAGGVSQLCKGPESSTIPNLAAFDRRWGLLAQYPLVERFGREQGLTREHIDAIHIKVEGADQGQFAFSHKLELAAQQWSGPQNLHDKQWPTIAELGGTAEVMRKHQVTVDESFTVPGFAIPEWAEARTREDIDLDRLQYIAAEGLLWFDNDAAEPAVREKVRKALSPKNLTITPEGQLAFDDPDDALVVAKLLMLFSTEHWNDPVNRAHLHLGIHAVQRAITSRRMPWMTDIDRGETRDPVAYFHAIDSDFIEAMRTGSANPDNFMYLVNNVLNASGMEERKRFIDYRLKEYSKFLMDDQSECYPSEYLEPKRVEFGPRNASVSTELVELTEEQRAELAKTKLPKLNDSDTELSYTVGSLKNRYTDPYVRVGSGFKRLSEVRPQYKKLLEENQKLQHMGVEVCFAFTPDYAKEFREGMSRNDQDFEGIVKRTAMTVDQRRRLLEHGAQQAIQHDRAAGRLILRRELPGNLLLK